ncbi:peptide MFS transporter [Companilactobacillus mishanensis]|uniref:Di-/tripeptide transporter n=1 Tax=Companilactobacillus mishanensis TaxID=2486008 RepID=A0A5P0ZHE1_9LACO|nr:peptide MFS transporter [Companilactobacillus mishanensis]MQS45711.1 peptide MFS transporter [Companilactobacillus mishanensis]MQS52480.1 peptide MFS transporter [Companilactobacillus mishanensis]MQS89137.1 peptide MFS transporter [Companilactobacillus mishanensis]
MDAKKDRGFLGQPAGLRTLFLTEFWERFSYYGMRAILLFYMYYAIEKGGLGMDQTTAASIMAIYGAMVYMTGVVGGWISDRILGPRRTVFWGGVLIMFGHIVLSLPIAEGGLFGSIILITIGTGLLKPNVSDMVGSLYTEKDPRRDSGFSIYVMGINLGSLIAPILVPWAANQWNFHVGFSFAAIGMFIGLVVYWLDGRKYLPESGLHAPDPINIDERSKAISRLVYGLIAVAVIVAVMFFTHTLTVDNAINIISALGIILPIIYFVVMLRSKKVTKIERSRVLAYIPLFIAAVVFWAIEEQGSVIMALLVAEQTQLHIGGWNLQAGTFQMLNPFFIIIYTPFFAWLWIKLGKRQPSSPSKFWLGLVFTAASYFLLVLPLMSISVGDKISPWWLVGQWALIEVGEMLISPVGLSATTKLAPKAFSSQMMSMWFLADSAGQSINAQLVKLFKPGVPSNEMAFFGITAIVVLIIGIILALFVPKIKPLMKGVN